VRHSPHDRLAFPEKPYFDCSYVDLQSVLILTTTEEASMLYAQLQNLVSPMRRLAIGSAGFGVGRISVLDANSEGDATRSPLENSEKR